MVRRYEDDSVEVGRLQVCAVLQAYCRHSYAEYNILTIYYDQSSCRDMDQDNNQSFPVQRNSTYG
jgi:hypothetical protein